MHLRTEILAGITTFCTMAYIIMVNPMILHGAGMNYGAVFVATCLSAALGSLLMGVLANYPIALAPSMGLNAYFTYVVVQELHFSWQAALGIVFVASVLFVLLVVTGAVRWLVDAIPHTLKIAVSAGIGLFLGVIALKNLGFTFSHFHPAFLLNTKIILCMSGLLLMILLGYFRITGAILLGIVAITLAGLLLGLTKITSVMASPPSITPVLFHLQFPVHWHLQFIAAVLIFLLVMVFDNTGTLITVLQQTQEKSNASRLTRALFASSTAAMSGSLLGTSPTGSYIESATGVRAGGRTGVTAVTVSILFLGALFFAPLAAAIPAYATAAALLYVAGLMLKNLKLIPWRDWTESLPALITVVGIPYTFSIADGVCAGFVSYAVLKLLTRKRVARVKHTIANSK